MVNQGKHEAGSSELSNTVVDWLKAGLAQPGKSKTGLAEHVGVSKQAVTKWVKTGQISRENMLRAGEYFGKQYDPSATTPAPLTAGPGIITYDSPDELPPGEYEMIPVLDVKVSAGAGVWTEDRADTRYSLAFLNGWLRRNRYKPQNLKILEVTGDSMESRIFDGDIVVIDVSDTQPKSGHVYALVYQDWVYLKRLTFRLDGTIEVRSDNEKYPVELVPPDQQERLKIIGRCVWAGGGGGL